MDKIRYIAIITSCIFLMNGCASLKNSYYRLKKARREHLASKINIQPIRQRQRHYRQILKDMGATDGEAARMSFSIEDPFPLKYENTLVNTPIFHHLTMANGGRPIEIVHMEGYFDRSSNYYFELTSTAKPDHMVIVYWDLITSEGERYIGFASDRNINFRRKIAASGKFLPLYMSQPALLVNFRENTHDRVTWFEKISVGKDEDFEFILRKNNLRHQGFMRDVFVNLEAFLKKERPGWVLKSADDHKAVKEFLMAFEVLPQEDHYLIPGSRMSVDEFRTAAEAIIAYTKARLRKGPFEIREVYQAYSDISVQFIDRIIYSQFEVSEELITSVKSSPARLSDIIEQYILSHKAAREMA